MKFPARFSPGTLLLAALFMAMAAPRLAAEESAALPPADALVTVLSNEVADDEPRTPINPSEDLLSISRTLFVTVAAKGDFEFTFGTQISAENVPGLAPGTVVFRADNNGLLSPEHRTERVEIAYPDKGFLPGTYRLTLYHADEPTRVARRIIFRTHLVDLPPAAALDLILRPGQANADRDPAVAPAAEFSSWPGKIFAELTAKAAVNLDFGAQVVTEEVPGLPPGLVIGALTRATEALTPDRMMSFVELDFPRIGLPPGRYRLEIIETPEPHRVVKTMTFTTHDTEINVPEFNLADSEFGGLLESVTGENGAGYSWASLLLVRDNTVEWTPLGPPAAGQSVEPAPGALPCDLVVSFYQHETALVSAVELVSFHADRNLPQEVEIWGSTQSATDGFTRLATATFEPNSTPNRIELPPTQLRFLKVRILSKLDPAVPLQLGALRVIEGRAPGYQPLAQRQPALANWRLQPRHAAQRGLYFLQPTATVWQQSNYCLGCHVQSQTLVGINIARRNDYVVSGTVEKLIADFAFSTQGKAGNMARTPDQVAGLQPDAESANTIYAALGLAYAPHGTTPAGTQLELAAHWLAGLQGEEGSIMGNDGRAPIEQGEIMFTGNCLDVWSEALKVREDPALRQAFGRGLAYVAQAETSTTQDKTFKIMVLARYGDEAQKKLARQLCAQLQLEQQADGGWKIEADDTGGSAAFSTGQALYAFRLAGINPNSRSFQRGVLFLIMKQMPNGAWKDPQLSSNFAATMWPVIALAGSFGSQVEPAHIMVTALPRPPAPRPVAVVVPPPVVVVPPQEETKLLPKNIEFVLDCSLSMDDRLGKSTRIDTAKQVMRDIIGRLPADTNVGLRLYGHRYNSMTAQSPTDTQLMVPIQPLDRAKLLKVIDDAVAHGQTPLVYSTLKAGDDLKQAGGGTIIVVTDGEESCGGKPRKAGVQLAALGVPLRLDIIGFTLTGKRVVDDLTAFTGATGGRYYTAADGAALSKALADAITPTPRLAAPPAPTALVEPVVPPAPVIEDFTYEIFNATGEKVATATTLGVDAADLPPGLYRIVLHDGSRQVVLPQVNVTASDTLSFQYNPGTGQLAAQK